MYQSLLRALYTSLPLLGLPVTFLPPDSPRLTANLDSVDHEAALELLLSQFNQPLTNMPVANPTRSFWTHGEPNANPLARKGSDGTLTEDADICIIGSGITGVSAAYHLAKVIDVEETQGAPLNTVILEARDFCSGATGRNGGHLTAAAYSAFRARAASFGTAEAMKALAIEKYTTQEILRIIEEENLAGEVDLVSGGHVTLMFTRAEEQAARADVRAAAEAGVDMGGLEWYGRERMRKEFGTSYPAYHWQGHNLWPLKLVTHLFLLANRSSALNLRLHTHTPVSAVSAILSPPSSTPFNITMRAAPKPLRRWRLTTPRGAISCASVLHATNGYAAALVPSLSGPQGIVPVRGQVIATRATVHANQFVNASYGGNAGFEYWFPRPVGEEAQKPLVILGGGRETSNPPHELGEIDDSVVNQRVGTTLRKFLPVVFPGKFEEGQEPEMEWTGIMGYTKIGDPFVGPVRAANDTELAGQFVSAGYSGHGMPRAFACAEAVAKMVVSDMMGRAWKSPEWLPKHYLTWLRPQMTHGSAHYLLSPYGTEQRKSVNLV